MLNHAQLARADANLLVLFDLLIEERNAGRVAARLNLSPSAVSHALRRLRALLGDPLFLPTAKGMMPTVRAMALAPAIRDIVEQVAGVIASAQPFDPATSDRRFRVASPDGSASLLVPALVRHLQAEAPGVDLAILQVLPSRGAADPDHAWREALTELASGHMDMAILPYRPQSARFHSTLVYAEDFIFATRRDHSLGPAPSLEQIAAARHVLVSASGDTSGFVDRLFAERGLGRRIALTVPSFLMAAAAIASSDLIGALPRRFVTDAARNYDLQIVEPPFIMMPGELHAIVPQASMMDQGISWLAGLVSKSIGAASTAGKAARPIRMAT